MLGKSVTNNQSSQTAETTPTDFTRSVVGTKGLNGRPADSDYALSGVIGRQFSAPLARMQKALEEIETTQHFSPKNMMVLSSGVNLANKLAMQSQQIARLAGGRLTQSHEKLKLDTLLSTALEERAEQFRNGGIEVFQRINPVEVIVDAGLLYSLIEAALDWACGLGRKLTVTLEIKNWPEHGLLILKTSHVVASSHEDEGDGHPS